MGNKAEIIIWHPYPKEKPLDMGDKEYLVTVQFENTYFVTSARFVYGDHFDLGRDCFVKSWADMPSPYVEGSGEFEFLRIPVEEDRVNNFEENISNSHIYIC